MIGSNRYLHTQRDAVVGALELCHMSMEVDGLCCLRNDRLASRRPNPVVH